MNKVKSTKRGFRMSSPEYHVSIVLELHRMGEGWETHELQWPVEKRCVGFTIPKGQLTNFQMVAQMAGNVASLAVNDASVAEGIKAGQLKKTSGLTA